MGLRREGARIQVRPCLKEDLDLLREISRETYDETFREMNDPAVMDAYLREAFNPKKLLSELSNSSSRFYFLFVDGELAGYLKTNDASSQTDINDPDSLEIERLYVRKAFKGRGYGSLLMEFALRKALEMKKRFVWLGVWEKNDAAISFYRRMGFEEAGKHAFRMGDEVQSDLVMKKILMRDRERDGRPSRERRLGH